MVVRGVSIRKVTAGEKEAAMNDFNGTEKVIHKERLCPHCGEPISVNMVFKDVLLTNPASKQDQWEDALSDEQRQILDLCEKNGVLASFEMALRVAQQGNPNVRKFFLSWLKLAAFKRIPYETLQRFAREFHPARIDYAQANGVGAVIANNRIKWFFPSTAIHGIPVRGISGNLKAMNPPDQNMFNEWIRTKRGYVAFEGAMHSELRTSSIGELLPLSTRQLKPFQAGIVGHR